MRLAEDEVNQVQTNAKFLNLEIEAEDARLDKGVEESIMVGTVHWTRDKLALLLEGPDSQQPNRSMRYPTKIQALEYANELFKHEKWVLLTVLNKDGRKITVQVFGWTAVELPTVDNKLEA